MPLGLPAGEVPFTDVERNLIDLEPPGFFPANQNSYWGTFRKVFADYINGIFDKMDTYYLNMSAETVDAGDMREWEEELDIPLGEGIRTLEQRRGFVLSRLQYGAFTRTRRRLIVENFIIATFGTVVSFSPDGVPLDAGGIPLYGETTSLVGLYNIVENVGAFSYDVRIKDTILLDQAGLQRELARITPAGITFTISMVPVP